MAVKMKAGGVRKAKFTSEELDGIQTATGKTYELIRGELHEVMPSLRHGRVVVEAARVLNHWAHQSHAGEFFRTVATRSREGRTRFAAQTLPSSEPAALRRNTRSRPSRKLRPTLPLRFARRSDTWRELEEKARQYFAAGCGMVWFLEIDQFLGILRSNGERRRLGLDDTVEVDDVLEGLRCRVRDFFPKAP